MEFDPESQTLKCPSCGTSQEISDCSGRIREHLLTADARRKIRAEEKTSHTMECPGCGARIEVDASSTAAECPYCGSKYVLASKQEDTMVPDGVLPFQFDREAAVQKFGRWVQGRFWAPGKLKHLYQRDRLQGIYLPYWTFDARSEASYTARGGRDHRETYREGGKTRTRIYTVWRPVSGHISYFFDDLLIPASSSVDPGLLDSVDSFDTSSLAVYSPEYLSGYSAECFSLSLNDAGDQARMEMERRLRRMAEDEVLKRYDHVDSMHISPVFSEETFKYILVPVYSTAYQYGNRIYHVLINGQTGRISGEYPKSILKIGFCILLAVLAAVLIFYFF